MMNIGSRGMSAEDQRLIANAITLSLYAHANQPREHSIIPGGTPYASHAIEVAGMVLANGGTASVCAAAALHDLIEDQGIGTVNAIEEQCGREVLDLVWECTEEGTGGATKAPWRDRKQSYIAHIGHSSLGAILIKVADKLQSARELARKCRQEGGKGAVIARFGGGYTGQEWFHASFIQAIQDRLDQESEQGDPMLIGAFALLDDLIAVCQWLFGGEA